MKFILNGCDISFVADAPEDITLKQLIIQCDRIKPDWCACGICSADDKDIVEIQFSYDNVWKVEDDVSCTIKNLEELEDD